MNPEKIILIGNGGHLISCKDICDSLCIPSTQIKLEELDIFLENINYLTKNLKFFVCLGDMKKREELIDYLKKRKLTICSLIHPTAVISISSNISEGSFIGANTFLGANTYIGTASIINTSSIIEHGSIVGEYTNIGPNSVLCGNVVVGSKCFIGASSTIIENLKIVDNVLIAAGAVVIKNIELEYSRQKGVPSESW